VAAEELEDSPMRRPRPLFSRFSTTHHRLLRERSSAQRAISPRLGYALFRANKISGVADACHVPGREWELRRRNNAQTSPHSTPHADRTLTGQQRVKHAVTILESMRDRHLFA
jgi:hypothetical protein